MAKSKRKTGIEALKDDKWGLPIINGFAIVFLGFLVFGTFVGFLYAVAIFGMFVPILIALTLGLGKNMVAAYANAEVAFHLYVFTIIVTLIVIFLFLYYPKRLKS